MKANELNCKSLMIGDWVMVNDVEHTHPLQVTELFMKSGTLYTTLYWDDMPDNVNPETLTADVDKVLPIPLTPEILEKNLATEPQIAWCVGWNKKDDIHAEIKREDLNAAFYGVIDFVHQLQHALRLCGIDKNIVL